MEPTQNSRVVMRASGALSSRRIASVIASVTGTLLLVAAPAAARGSDPLVRVDRATLVKRGHEAVVTARIAWNQEGIREDGMIVGDVRLLAVIGRDARPRQLASSTSRTLASEPVQSVRFVLTSAAALRAIRTGNRVVLTASQHAHSPSPELKTPRTYVTVRQLQAGAPRRVGLRDCAGQPIVAHADLTSCDLVAASLVRAQVGSGDTRTELMKADLTGADLRDADLSHVDLAGGRVNGANATHATIFFLSLAKADGVGFIAPDTRIDSSDFFDARLIGARFAGASFVGTSLGRSVFDHADFSGATIAGAFMQVADLHDANLRRATLTGDDLYFADLTQAKLLGASMDTSPATLMWTILCRTELPDGTIETRDCAGQRVNRRRKANSPFVTVDAMLRRGSSRATIEGTVRWSANGIDAYNMRVRCHLRTPTIGSRSRSPARSSTRCAEATGSSLQRRSIRRIPTTLRPVTSRQHGAT
jgi:uncharacterized protein YjbI with pentapeptide repeats